MRKLISKSTIIISLVAIAICLNLNKVEEAEIIDYKEFSVKAEENIKENYLLKEIEELKLEEEFKKQFIEDKEIKAEEIEIAQKAEIKQVSRGETRSDMFVVTAYDLSVESCGKKLDHPAYGLTASGYSLKGQTREEAMVIASDPKIIPLGTKVQIEFITEGYEEFNGVYTSKDKGGAIKGRKVDLFMGDFQKEKSDQSVWDFGKVEAKITILK